MSSKNVVAPVFLGSCVGWPKRDTFAEGGLSEAIDRSLEITAETFKRRIGVEAYNDIEEQLGYGKNQFMRIADDYAVSFHRSKWHSHTIYYLRHSAIEYVFGSDAAFSRFLETR